MILNQAQPFSYVNMLVDGSWRRQYRNKPNFFHLNRLSSSMVIKMDFDLAMTILAYNLYRLLALDLPGYENNTAVTLYEKFIQNNGVSSMDGIIANLPAICDLAEKYRALVMVDDSHAVGFMGEKGRGTPEYCGVEDRIDINTGTLGKALGGASGGYTSERNVKLQRRGSAKRCKPPVKR